jgi:predicted nucleic acid-binding protein
MRYKLLGIMRSTIRLAVTLTQSYRLRGCDAIQLATALNANRDFQTTGFPTLTFVASDEDLLAAARAERLVTENPNTHA